MLKALLLSQQDFPQSPIQYSIDVMLHRYHLSCIIEVGVHGGRALTFGGLVATSGF